MAGLTYAQLEGVWLQAAQGTQYQGDSPLPGVSWPALMAAIAMAESGGDPNNTNPTDSNGKGGTQTSWGLWQISNGDHFPPSPNWNDPVTNANLAIAKLNSQGLSAWGTYTSGAYRSDLNTSTSPDTSGNYAVDTSAVTGSQAATASQAEANCAWRINFNIPVIGGDVCLVSWSQIRAITSAGILVGGGLLGLVAVGWLINTQTGVISAATGVAVRAASAAA